MLQTGDVGEVSPASAPVTCDGIGKVGANHTFLGSSSTTLPSDAVLDGWTAGLEKNGFAVLPTNKLCVVALLTSI
jgi:hypothetical protein